MLAAGTLLLINFKSYDDKVSAYKKIPVFVPILIGGLLGFISGAVGIGGGIFWVLFVLIKKY